MGRVDGGLNLTRSFGDFDYKRNEKLGYDEQKITCKPDIVKYDRCKNDEFIIMGCDGIWEKHVDDSSGIVDLVWELLKTHNNKLNVVVEELLERLIAKESKEGVGCDNMTAILIMLQ
jgi:serine/threonine protein phosphatase PrpC